MDTFPAHGRSDLVRPPITYHSLTVPARLLTDLSDSPLAIGLYGLVARLFLIEQKAIPLSTGDVQRYDPALSRSAIVRAFARLVRGGWLIEQTTAGRKTCYTPAWGFVSGSPRAWRIGATLLDRPRRTQVVLLNKRLLDTCIGKLVPHRTNPATIERYLTHPLLSLVDIGIYLLLDNGGRVSVTERLAWLGLVRANHTLPLAADHTLLALASQRVLFDTTQPIALTKKGLLKLGCPPVDAVEDVIGHEQPLFFVSPDVFGSMTVDMDSNMTGCEARSNTDNRASVCAQRQHPDAEETITWMKGDQGNKETSTPRAPSKPAGGGGDRSQITKEAERDHPSVQPIADRDSMHDRRSPVVKSEVAMLLSSLNVCPTVIAELADQPLERVQAAIVDGKTRPGVRDLGGWVVSLVRLGRDHGWTIQPPIPRADSPEGLREAFARYAAQQEAEQNGAGDARMPLEQLPPATEAPSDGLLRIWHAVQTTLQVQTTRQEFNTWIRSAKLRSIERGVATIAVPNAMVKETIECRYLTALRDLLGLHAGEPTMVRVVLCRDASPDGGVATAPSPSSRYGPPQSAPPALSHVQSDVIEQESRPSWIRPEHWETLPRMLRAALIDSALVDGAVKAASPYLSRLLETRYARELDGLITLSCRANAAADQ